MEFMWRSQAFGSKRGVLTHVLFEHYNLPIFMDYRSVYCCFTDLMNYNDSLPYCYEALKTYVKSVQSSYATENILVLFGDDIFFKDLEVSLKHFKFIKDLAQYSPDIEVVFATPSEYFREVVRANTTFGVFEGDLLPYVSEKIRSRPISWTGFYASRPGLKQKIVETHTLVRTAEILEGLGTGKDFNSFDTCLTLHHDAITGTCQPAPFRDYMRRLDVEQGKVEEAIGRFFNSFAEAEAEDRNSLQVPMKVFVFFNTLSWSKDEIVQVRGDWNYVLVKDVNGEVLEVDVVEVGSGKRIFFSLRFYGFEFKTLFVQNFNSRCEGCSRSGRKGTNESVVFGLFKFWMNRGLIQRITLNNEIYNIEESLLRVDSNEGGAYEYRPMVSSI